MAYVDEVYFNTPLGSIQAGSGCNMDTKCVAYNMQGVGKFNKTDCFLQPFHCRITFISPISILPSIYAQNIIKMTIPTNIFTRSFDLFLSLSENSMK